MIRMGAISTKFYQFLTIGFCHHNTMFLDAPEFSPVMCRQKTGSEAGRSATKSGLPMRNHLCRVLWLKCYLQIFGLDCVLLSVCSWKCYILLNILRVTVAWIIVTFYCLHQISKFFHKTSRVWCCFQANLILGVHINFHFQSTKLRKLRVLGPV